MKTPSPTLAASPNLQQSGILPNNRQAALLRAALGQEGVLSNWKAYQSGVDIRGVDEGEARLFSMVWQHLSPQERGEGEAAQLRSYFRQAALRHRLIVQTAHHVNDVLKNAGVTAVFLKGFALQMRAYGPDIIRPMSDVDIFVSSDQLEQAFAAGKKAGWVRAEKRTGELPLDSLRSVQTKTTFATPAGIDLDLHWVPRQVMEFSPSACDDFLRDSTRVNFDGASWSIPSDSWLVFETLEHGLGANQIAPIRWVADAQTLMGQADFAPDWKKITGFGQEFHIGKALLTGLSFLRKQGADVPNSVIDSLAGIAYPRLERIECALRFKTLRRPIHGIAASAAHFFLRSRANPLKKLLGFPRFYWHNTLHFYGFRQLLSHLPAWIKEQ